MDKITITARSVDEAVDKAAEQLDVTRDQIEFSVTSEGNKGGLFGMGAKEAVIEAWLADENALLSPFLTTLLDKMELPCVVEAEYGDKEVLVTMTSPHAASIIGKRGETLSALQYLTNIVENRGRRADGFTRYTLDIENYREKRVQALQYQAKSAATKVVKTGRSFILDPLNPYERRIVHSYLQTVEGVSSHSIGEDPNRKIVISKK